MKNYCEEIAKKVWYDLSKSNLVTAEKLGRVPEIHFTPLGDKFLGMAYANHIELNENYLLTQDKEKLKITLLHELAHVAEYRSTGIMGHGPLWHAICLYIGGNGDSRGDLPNTENTEATDIFFGFSAIIALAGALFLGIYCAFNFLGITNKILCGACGISGIVLSIVLWAGCCKTFEQVKTTVIIQAILSIIFTLGVLS
jgi:hypothetical protein